MNRTPALSARKRSKASLVIGTLFILVFAVAFIGGGATLFYLTTVRPLLSVSAAKSWVSAPCTIISSEVQKHGGKTPTYSLQMAYWYEAGGRRRHATRYNFVPAASSSRGWRDAVVHEYPAGRQTTCYVDPQNADEAVINRDFHLEMLWGCFGLIFPAIGLTVLAVAAWYAVAGRHRHGRPGGALSSGSRSGLSARQDPDEVDEGPITLKPAMSRTMTLLMSIVFALFWNGIVGVFAYQFFREFQRAGFGAGTIFSGLFLMPFLLVGVFLIGWCVACVLNLFSPSPVLTLDRGRIRLGGSARLSWTFSGNPAAIEKLTISLKGREEATYRRGKSTATEKSLFYDQPLLEISEYNELSQGELEFTVPPDLMHTFSSTHSSIRWGLNLHAEIARWPDVKVEFPLMVTPREVPS